jgi:competence protein ComEC
VRWLKRGDSFDKPDVKVQVLWPPKDYAPRNSNNASLVLLLTLNTGQTILLAGDMEAPVEKAILADISQVDVMLMPHHGSKTSSTLPFVKKVRPKIVVAQTGFHNHYGFPKGEVVQRYQDVGSQVLNTADDYVAIQFSKQGIKVQ